jgi:hypothetical protein
LDLFGGDVSYEAVVAWQRAREAEDAEKAERWALSREQNERGDVA